jgi:hypothetical protein
VIQIDKNLKNQLQIAQTNAKRIMRNLEESTKDKSIHVALEQSIKHLKKTFEFIDKIIKKDSVKAEEINSFLTSSLKTLYHRSLFLTTPRIYIAKKENDDYRKIADSILEVLDCFATIKLKDNDNNESNDENSKENTIEELDNLTPYQQLINKYRMEFIDSDLTGNELEEFVKSFLDLKLISPILTEGFNNIFSKSPLYKKGRISSIKLETVKLNGGLDNKELNRQSENLSDNDTNLGIKNSILFNIANYLCILISDSISLEIYKAAKSVQEVKKSLDKDYTFKLTWNEKTGLEINSTGENTIDKDILKKALSNTNELIIESLTKFNLDNLKEISFVFNIKPDDNNSIRFKKNGKSNTTKSDPQHSSANPESQPERA